MSRDFPVKGLKDIDTFLSALPKNMQKSAYRTGLTAAAAVVRDEARIRAPKGRTGKMARAIKSGSPRQNQDGTFSISVRADPKAEHGFLAYFHEFGVARHLIASTGKGEGRVAVRKAHAAGEVMGGVIKIGDDFVSGTIDHPGHAARAFLRPALDVKADEAVQAFANRIRAFLEGKTGFAAPLDEAA